MNEPVKQFPVKPAGCDRRRGCGIDWTSAEIGRLIRLRLARNSTTFIASALDRTPQAVRLKLNRLGIVIEPHRAPRGRSGAA